MRDLFSTRAADLGLMIMALMGFAHYMDHIGANEAVVRVVTKPLRALRSPYVLLFFSYLLASLLQLVISFGNRACRVADGDDVPHYAGVRALSGLGCRGHCYFAWRGLHPDGNRCYQGL